MGVFLCPRTGQKLQSRAGKRKSQASKPQNAGGGTMKNNLENLLRAWVYSLLILLPFGCLGQERVEKEITLSKPDVGDYAHTTLSEHYDDSDQDDLLAAKTVGLQNPQEPIILDPVTYTEDVVVVPSAVPADFYPYKPIGWVSDPT